MTAGDDGTIGPPAGESAGAGATAWVGELSQREFDIAFYERVLERQPHDVQLLRLLGELYAREGRHDQAVRVDRQLVQLLPSDATAHYNLACSLAMRGAPRRAIEELGRAIECGYNDFSHLEVDPDLESVRQLPQYRALLEQYGLDG